MTIALADQLIIAPILLPLAASALILLFGERQRRTKNVISLFTVLALLAIALVLFQHVVSAGFAGQNATRAYHVGNWPAPFGIVLVVDWLSALMLLLTSILGVTSLVYSLSRWESAGPRFHVLFLLQLMGLNGAFLTGDIFNLFVFFEVLLAASYGLLLHGSGQPRVKAGLHYVAINIMASLLFLVGAGMIYGVTGTLNMADLALRIASVQGGDLALLQSGIAILGVAFLIKAGMWPLGFWLPGTYAVAVPPVAALFAILSKVGIYALLRVYLLLFGGKVGWTANFGEEWLLYGGLATIAFGTIGLLSARSLSRLAGYSVIVSSGTLLACLGVGQGAVLAGALFYLVSSTLGLSAFYLLLEMIERKDADPGVRTVVEPMFEDEDTQALEEDESEIGVVIPVTIAILGAGFLFCALLLAGMPPLSGFIAKFAILHGLIGLDKDISPAVWTLVTLLILSGLAMLVATSRAGIDLLWTPTDRPQPILRLWEAIPVGVLLLICLGLILFAGPVMQYMERTGRSLQDRGDYIHVVLPRAQAEPAP
ncbi:K(+)/H(+) antiporter subunit D [Caenibius tardaugens NBRC 16725]|uniref:K(+)/H(+) antiporter subunit D n=1 Tax=Caenibius tardaugens NBRC 16725 TaxID=1219035 RepID=U2YMZ3_9SPHN|nr:monovalent cation/H+ antiporter subunit D [Caenibius tardaugens]AZI35557.1 monovalent cation/H+ antiporter subunit D [Caenibius tardaugens NBRC 16725]GAD50160.1 K(+)/H(+) antiporter subunit D [Caenibius tardaugens NBRC 16725]